MTKMSRPKKEIKMLKRVNFRVTQEEYDMIRIMAELGKEKFSDYCRRAVVMPKDSELQNKLAIILKTRIENEDAIEKFFKEGFMLINELSSANMESMKKIRNIFKLLNGINPPMTVENRQRLRNVLNDFYSTDRKIKELNKKVYSFLKKGNGAVKLIRTSDYFKGD
jgi:uncharacterized protein (DUF1778 family)